jgi:hypothetical protein
MTLDQYFHLIINNKPKVQEKSMFDNVKASMQSVREKFALLWTKPTTFVDNSQLKEEDYWAFEMMTSPWYNEHDEAIPTKHTMIVETTNGTWMEMLDQILDSLNEHYGYDIKEQVYYSVKFPLNEVNPDTHKPYAGYGRSLNDDVLQQLLLAHPEVYDTVPFGYESKKGIFE